MTLEGFGEQDQEWRKELGDLEAKIDTLDVNGLKRYIELTKMREEASKQEIMKNLMRGAAAAIISRNFSHGYGKELLEEIKKESAASGEPISEEEVKSVLDEALEKEKEEKDSQ